jgi:uncharacterized alkaline shock family protein YloU
MKKESFNNLIFVLFLVIIIFVSAVFFSFSLKPFTLGNLLFRVNHYYNVIYYNLLSQIILGLIAVLLFVLAVYLIWRKEQYKVENLSIAQKTAFGEVKISINSLKRLVLQVVRKIGEIKEVKTQINLLKTGDINIDLHLSVKQDVNIPELSEKIQKRLKDYLLETSGIEVKEIKIHIDKIFYNNEGKES